MLTSPTYWPVPRDWPEHVEATGLTVWGRADAALPPGLRAYLEDGEPPVLVTLGTSAATNARGAFELVAEAVEQAGSRAVLLVGNERNARDLAHRDDVWRFAPLPAVLPHVRAVVHAAGHGTVTAALHAGVPQVALPQTFDQVEHARRLSQLGVGTTVPWRRRSRARVQAALARADDGEVRATAAAMADALGREDGAVTAADRLEALLPT